MAGGPRRGRGESPTEKFLRLEKSGAALVKVNVGGIVPDRPEEEKGIPVDAETSSPDPSEHESDADRD